MALLMLHFCDFSCYTSFLFKKNVRGKSPYGAILVNPADIEFETA